MNLEFFNVDNLVRTDKQISGLIRGYKQIFYKLNLNNFEWLQGFPYFHPLIFLC